MNILCANCGSSSLKLDIVDTGTGSSRPSFVARGQVDRIGTERSSVSLTIPRSVRSEASIDSHAAAFAALLALLREVVALEELDAVGHRVVHGGPTLTGPVLLDDGVMAQITAVSELAPVHNRAALEVIAAAREELSPDLPAVATFDTGFFATLPEVAWRYALPRALSDDLRIRRYGFHGLAHRFMVERFAELSAELERPRIVTLQLGSGCSGTASISGRPIDTSMGFTPLEGMIMGTRSGSIDPSVPLFLHSRGMQAPQVERMLNHESGLLGLSGTSADVRDLLDLEHAGDSRAGAALDAFCYSIKKYVGSFAAAMGGLDAVVFGGGIGENSPEIRARICSGMSWCGLELDPERNVGENGEEAMRLSVQGGVVQLWAVRVSEAEMIAQDVRMQLEKEI